MYINTHTSESIRGGVGVLIPMHFAQFKSGRLIKFWLLLGLLLCWLFPRIGLSSESNFMRKGFIFSHGPPRYTRRPAMF